MAKVNLERRAAIGEAKRARTRASILNAARGLYADPPTGPVTVEMVTQAAGVAKGTFYLHFPDLAALEAELGNALIADLTERLEPARQRVRDPMTRLATAVTIFLHDLAAAPAQAGLAARAVFTLPEAAHEVQLRMLGDLEEAQSVGMLKVSSPDLAVRLVVAIVEQAAWLFSTGRIDSAAIPDIIRAVLRAIGCTPDEAAVRYEEAAHNAGAFAKQVAQPDSTGT